MQDDQFRKYFCPQSRMSLSPSFDLLMRYIQEQGAKLGEQLDLLTTKPVSIEEKYK